MIPILFQNTETTFTSNGLGRLSDCVSCTVTEERNGIYELEFEYPVTGVHFEDIQIGRIVACTHDDHGDVQPFDIYRKTEPIDGIVTFYASHISYRLNEITLKPFTATSCADAFLKIPANSIGTNPFTFYTNKAVTADLEVAEPRSLRSLLAGEEGSILDVYGTGEYEFDKWTVNLYLHRGTDTNVSIRYGKNLAEFESDTDAGEVYTAVVPFWSGTDEDDDPVLVTLPEWFISSGNLSPGGREVIVPMDLTDAFEEEPTVAELRTAATSRLTNSNAWIPKQNINVDFVQLWQTDEYKDYAPLQRLGLCDTCEIVVPMYGYNFRAKVIRVVYNTLLDRYDEMELGDKLDTFADTLVKPVEDAVEKAISTTKSVIEAALEKGIQDAMELIRGGMGGYIVQTVNAQGQPIELLVTDNLDLTQAVNIWRWNLGGLAHSSNGYNGPYDVAITQDGKINASMILTGVLSANLITAGTISDSSGLNYWDLDSGEFVTKHGQVGGFALSSTDMSYGDITAARSQTDAVGMKFGQDKLIYVRKIAQAEPLKIEIDGRYITFFAADNGVWKEAAKIDANYGLATLFKIGGNGTSSISIGPPNGSNTLAVTGGGSYSGSLQIYGNLSVSGTYPSAKMQFITGSISSSGTIQDFADYAALVFVGKPSGASVSSVVVPTDAAAGNTWQIADNSGYISFTLAQSGSDLDVTKNHGNNIMYVYGLK